MKKYVSILLIVLTMLCIFSPSISSVADGTSGVNVSNIATLDEAVQAAENANVLYYRDDVWSQLQTELVAAKELALNTGYFAIRADVASGHMNENRYLSRVGSSGDNGGTTAVLRYTGHGTTATEKNEFDNDQIWLMVYTDDTHTTFTLCNLEGNYLRVGSAYSGGRMLRTGALPSNVSEAYFTQKDMDNSGSCLLAPVDQTAYKDYIVDFTRKTHQYADTAASRPTNMMLAKSQSSISEKTRCIFETVEEYNTELQAEKTAQMNVLKELLAQQLDEPLSAETAQTLEEALFVAGYAQQSDYSETTWIELQETIAEATALSLQQGQFVIGAGVADGHHNEGRYITASGGQYDSYMTLRYCGKGDSANDLTEFTNDQIWIKTYVDGLQDVFTLQNVSTGGYLYAGNAIGSTGYIVSAYTEPSSINRSYWTVKNDMLFAAEQSGLNNHAVDFTKVTDNVPDTQSQPRTNNYFHTRSASAITYRSEPIFTRLDNAYNENLDKEKEEMLTRLVNILRRVNGSSLGNLADLYNDISENDSSLNYSEEDYESLSNWMTLASATLKSELYRIEIGNNAAYADNDGYVKYDTVDETNLRQLWSRESVAGSTDKDTYYSFRNAITGTYMYQSDEQNPIFSGISDFGNYIKHTAEVNLDNTDRMLFILGSLGNLQPKYNSSTLASNVSIVFKETNGEKKVFSDAGEVAEKKVRIVLVSQVDLITSIAEECYENLYEIRSRRNDYSETFTTDDLQHLLTQAKYELNQGDKYSQGSVEQLQAATEAVEELLAAKADGENVTVAQLNVCGITLKSAIKNLSDKNSVADVIYKTRLLTAMNTLSDAKDDTDDLGVLLYCEPCIKSAEEKLAAAQLLIADASATFAQVDDMTDVISMVYENLVLDKNYYNMFVILEGVRNRNPEEYQPQSWNQMYSKFLEVEKIYETVSEYTNAEILAANQELTTLVNKLKKRATLTTIQALIDMLENLNLNQSAFTEETWQPYSQYLAKAVELVNNPDAQQGSIDAIINSLVVAANSLRYTDTDAAVGLLPDVLIGYPQNIYDRYDEGYALGNSWGAYDGYNAAYTEGYNATINSLKSSAAQPEEEIVSPVQEVTQVITKTTEKIYLTGGVPMWLVYVFIVSGIVLLVACCLLGILVAKKQKTKKNMKTAVTEEGK